VTAPRRPGRGRPGGRGWDEGIGSVLVLAAVGVVLVALAAAGILAQAVAARHRAATAADLSALAAAERLLSGHGSGDACTAARAAAAANGGMLAGCRVSGQEVEVTVRVASGPAYRLLRLPDPVRLARAGPVAEFWSG
jgi:secretion/DNA translocation related TadE-like protein